MNKYLITYQLKDKARNYSNFYLAIKNLGQWWHYLGSTWIVKTNLSSQQIWNFLGNKISNIDHLLIIKIDSKDKAGWLPKNAWDWLNS